MDFDKTIQLVQRSDPNVNLDPISKGFLSSFREEKDESLVPIHTGPARVPGGLWRSIDRPGR